MFGIKPNGEIKDILSYSGYSLWKKSKEDYRKRYYENQKSFENVETIFGKEVHGILEKDDKIKGSETRIEITLKCGLKLLSFLDSLDDEFTIIDFKTGHKNKEGKSPWNRLKVIKHKQLDFYSLMCKKKFGKVNPVVQLIWLETRFKTKETEFAGHTLISESRELELTGYQETFKRYITQWERDKMEKEIKRVAKEITKDFIQWQKSQKK